MAKEQPKTVEVEFYAQVKPDWSTWRYDVDATGHPILQGAKVVALTQNRPRRPQPGVVLCRWVLTMPSAAFLPLQPEIRVTIPEGMTEAISVEVLPCDDDVDPDPVINS